MKYNTQDGETIWKEDWIRDHVPYANVVRICSFSDPYSVQMRENTDQKTSNTDTLHAVVNTGKGEHELMLWKGVFIYIIT